MIIKIVIPIAIAAVVTALALWYCSDTLEYARARNAELSSVHS